MTNHSSRSTNNEPKDWTIRVLTDALEIRGPDQEGIKFRGTYAAAIARWKLERAGRSKRAQVTLYGSGPRVREARGLVE